MLSIRLQSHHQSSEKFVQINGIVFGSSIQTVMDGFNQNKESICKIDKLYNLYGQEIPQSMWKIQVKENMVFFIDQPNRIESNS